MNEVIFIFFLSQCFCLNNLSQKTLLSSSDINPINLLSEYNLNRTYSLESDENFIPIEKIDANSIYLKYNSNGEIEYKYDANNILSYNEFWCSSGHHSIKEEVSLYIILDKERIINSIWIYWAYAPGEFKVQYSHNGIEYNDYFNSSYILALNRDMFNVDEGQSINPSVIISQYLKNPMLIRKYHSFASKYRINENNTRLKTKFIKISFRIPINTYYAIFDMKIIEKSYTIGLLQLKNSKNDFCLSLPNHNFNSHSVIVAMNCKQMLSKGDNRGLFVIRSNGYITPYEQSSKCIMHKGGSSDDRIILDDCYNGEEYDDDRNKITEDRIQQLKFINSAYCISLHSNLQNKGSIVLSHLLKDNIVYAYSSSTIPDNVHMIKNVIDYDNESSFWLSELRSANKMNTFFINEPVDTVFIFNEEYPIYSIEIKWKYPAKKYNVYALVKGDLWQKIDNETAENSDVLSIVYLFEIDTKGIKIEMVNSSTKISGENVFGIYKINFSIKGYFAIKEKCNDNSKWDVIPIENYSNKWKEYYNKETMLNRQVSYLEKEIKINYEGNINKIIEQLERRVPILIKRVKEIGEKLKIRKGQLVNYIMMNAEYFDRKDNEENSEDNPERSCKDIKIKYTNVTNGFFYIKNECMKKALKVYCDFDTNHDYYFYNDSHTIVDENIETITQRKCYSIGLEPLLLPLINNRYNFYSLDIMLHLIISKTNILQSDIMHYHIPIAKYSNDTNTYHFISHNTSSDIYSSFLPSPNSSLLLQLNSLFNINTKDSSKNLLSYYYNYKNNSFVHKSINSKENSIVLGYLCSTNNNPKYDYSNYPLLNCTSTIQNINSSGTFQCPRKCLSQFNSTYPYIVIGSDGEYHEKSMICPSAIHSGIIKNREGGIINLKVGKKNKCTYKPKEENEIYSQLYISNNNTEKEFIITKYDLSCPIDEIKEKITIEESSFIEISNNNTLVNNPMIKEGLKYQLSIFNEYIIKSLEINNKLDKLLKEYDSIYKIIEKNKKEEEKITLLQEKVEWIKKQKEIQEKRQNSKKYKDISNSLNP